VRLVLLLAVFLLAGSSFVSPAQAAARSCGTVAFAPNSEDGAFDIRATGVGCATARRVARAARNTDVAPGTQRYRRAGFVCTGRYDGSGLPSVRFRCTRGVAVVRFVRS
jgi:hypothetical protein